MKIDRLTHLLKDTDPSIVVLTEHGLAKKELETTRLEGYSLITDFCRENHKLGGVAIYSKETLVPQIDHLDISDLCRELTCEAALARLKYKRKTLHILGVYRSPSENPITGINILSDILDVSQAYKNHVVLVGDINIDRLRNHPDNVLLEEELASHNIRRLKLPATRTTFETASSIDCICTNVTEKDTNAIIIQSGLSDHTAQICLIADKRRPCPTHQEINKRQMGTRNLNHLKAELKHSNWQPVHLASDSETAYNSFHTIINSALNATCPMKALKTGKKQGPTLSYDLEARTLKDDYIRALNRFETTGNNQDRETMIARKKLYDNKLRLLRQNLNGSYITDADNKTKAIWNVINKERKAKSCEGNQCKLEINNRTIDDPQDLVETFNTFFAQVAEKTLNQDGTTQNCQQDPINEPTCHRSLTLSPTTFNEVVNTIKSLKTKTSSGVDEYSSRAVKHCAEELTIPLVSIINKSFSEGHFPSALKLSKVYPKHKKGSISNLENYRPISLISTFSKLIEKIALHRLLNFLKQHNLITPSQHGFLKGRSTNTAIISLIEHIIEQIDNEQYIIGLFLDYSKAFDCLGHNLISKKLQQLGVRETAHKWFVSYLEGRQQVVETQYTVNKCTTTFRSSPQPMTRGVPQGSVLGPILFILLTNDFPDYIHSPFTTCIMYADDTTLLLNNNSADAIYDIATTSLTTALNYCKTNDLAMNPDKTTKINFSTRHDPIPVIPNILEQTSARFLGVTLDKNLTWNEHVDNICKKMSTGVYAVRRIKWTSNIEAAKIAYYALVDSHMRYGIEAWGGSSAGNLNRVLVTQKKAIRILADLNQGESCKQAFKTHGILTVTSLYILQVILYADNRNLETNQDIHNYNTRHAARYILPRHRTALFEKTPSYIGRKLKNLLPNGLQTLTGKILKKELQRYLQGNPVYTLDEFLGLLQ